MDHKKEHIIETGRDLFEKKGYYNTSMQDVAEACGISKATLYKLFRSKEDFSMAIICYMVEQMLCSIRQITENSQESPVEMLKSCISERMTGFSARSHFINEFLSAQPCQQREKYFSYINKLSLDIFLLFQQIIMQAFDMEDENLAGELTMSLGGLLREVSSIAWRCQIVLDRDTLLDYIVDSLQATQRIRQGKSSFLTPDILDRVRTSCTDDMEKLKPFFMKKALTHSLREALDNYEKTEQPACLRDAGEILDRLKAIEEKGI
ncbi:MAG TPA: TetR/AcrR family transcriptional regulator [Candidatus Copromorpha excrementigallinarum]|uniref:TetR/AcrR family transcriptional regulator n=1 Tax=Candidatus Allocopromorpha excrementigallinarum TaxID=2840742 RepID=A0A9D1L6S6_9FIRM|nr:TetR/AcrR family transcriptional regulator [Candidatus Copromorpha excrementigallinarum]